MEEVIKFVQEAKRHGMSDAEIQQDLRDAGWSEEVIGGFFTREDKDALPAQKKRIGKGKIIAIVVLIALVFAGYYFSGDRKAVEQSNEGADLREEGNVSGSIEALEQALREAESDVVRLFILINLGTTLASEGEETRALDVFERALPLAEVSSYEYHLVSAEIALLKNDPGNSLSHYLKALEKDPKGAQINTALSFFYLDPGDEFPSYADYDKALRHALIAHEAEPHSNIANQNLGLAYFVSENFDQAIIYLKRGDPGGDPDLAVLIGIAYGNIGDFEQARFYLQEASDGGITEADELLDQIKDR